MFRDVSQVAHALGADDERVKTLAFQTLKGHAGEFFSAHMRANVAIPGTKYVLPSKVVMVTIVTWQDKSCGIQNRRPEKLYRHMLSEFSLLLRRSITTLIKLWSDHNYLIF